MRRSYSDPIKARLSTVEDLKPTQWAGTVRTVALQAERHGWSQERITEVFDMLGMDAKAARDAKQALRRSIRLKWIAASTPTPKALPAPRALQPAAPTPVLPILAPPKHSKDGYRDPVGRFTQADFCVKGLHAMVDTNRLTRRDRSSVQCRACTVARGKVKPV